MGKVPHQFTFMYFRHILAEAIARGYKVSSFEKFDPEADRTFIVRHDVDYTLNGVLEMAKVEYDLGVTATFLFRVHAHEYNCFAPYVYRLIESLLSMGHEIGLHFEAMSVGRALSIHPPELLMREKSLLESVVGRKIVTASEHRDISQVVHATPNYHDVYDPLEAGFERYALEKRYFKEMKYLSDSNGFWREGDPTEHYDKHDRFQVLFHPDWWFEKDLLLKGPYFHGLGNV